MARDQRVDAYIARKPEFARPILEHLREAVHSACPSAEETLKWGAPAFMYKEEQLAMMAAFKAHATFGFWRGSLVVEESADQPSAMGQFGRLTSIADLPSPASLADLIRKAMKLTDAGIKPNRKAIAKPPLDTPDDLRSALGRDERAVAAFEAFSSAARREYIEWVTEAKQAATRERRIAQAVLWIADGKKRNWKYEKC